MENEEKGYSNDIFITITLSNFLKNKHREPKEQYEASREYLREIFREDDHIEYKITLIPELTKNYDIHYHGIFKWKNIDDIMTNLYNNDIIFYLKSKFKYYKKQIGFSDIQPVAHKDKVIEYIKKDLNKTNKYLQLRYMYADKIPVFVFDDYNLIANNIFVYMTPDEIKKYNEQILNPFPAEEI